MKHATEQTNETSQVVKLERVGRETVRIEPEQQELLRSIDRDIRILQEAGCSEQTIGIAVNFTLRLGRNTLPERYQVRESRIRRRVLSVALGAIGFLFGWTLAHWVV